MTVRLDLVDPTLGDLVLEVLDLPFQLVFSVDLGFDETLELFVGRRRKGGSARWFRNENMNKIGGRENEPRGPLGDSSDRSRRASSGSVRSRPVDRTRTRKSQHRDSSEGEKTKELTSCLRD